MKLFNINWRRLNNILHRDIGYFCVGLTIIYAVSGVAVNHAQDWDPDYSIEVTTDTFRPIVKEELKTEASVAKIVNEIGISKDFLNYYLPDPETVKIFLDGGTLTIGIVSGETVYENVKKRPVLREMNLLHLNEPKKLWTYVADIYAFFLLLLAIRQRRWYKSKIFFSTYGGQFFARQLHTSPGQKVPLVPDSGQGFRDGGKTKN